MADTDTETLPNGTGALNEEEEERLKQRPADIDADVREMERRKRVEALMSSKLFREELERVLDQQLHEGGDAPLLQRIREMVGGRLHSASFRGPACVLPINDIRGIEGVGYEKGEKILRCKLAAVYRLVDLFGWTQTGISGQITARLNTAVEQVLTTPRGLLPHEVTASSLVKVDMQGVVQDQGTTNFPVNVDGFSLHASVHAARPDIRCVLHIRSAPALAVSSMKCGLLPLCTEAALLGDIAYHHVPPGILDNEERDKLVRALGPSAKVLMLASGGALCCGATLEEAFHQARQLHAAADVQLRLAAVPPDQLIPLPEHTRREIYEASRAPPADASKWRVGGEEFEALMRMLDNAGFRTGHLYRHPLVKNEVPKPKNDVEVPPAVSSLGYLLEEEELYKQGVWKKGVGTKGERTRWLNSPNVYQKVEVLETGTSDPKKITKWVQDGSPQHSSTPVKIDTLQFVPKNTNPKEFKQLQQQIKDYRRADKISAGPQSHILEGVTWDEASKLVGEDAANTHTGDHVVLMGAASKGIIQRGYQHNATVYSAPYARNPFDHVTDTDIDEYRRVVERKHRAGTDYDTELSESEALSAAQVTSRASANDETEEESRDEHRVLRIETKQAPVRSQPEVVLSDVDTTDFLNAERSHADRTKGNNDVAKEVTNSQKRSHQEYSRSPKFDNIVRTFESPERTKPKCKTNLSSRMVTSELRREDHFSSKSSLYSIPSLEWDGRCKSEYALHTRSLPRHKSKYAKLFRTRSHSGFINSYLKDPEPFHYHVPKCMACGATGSSYAWELSKRSAVQSVYFSVDNIPQRCMEEATIVKIKADTVPAPKPVPHKDVEFVESQEFNEDNYLGDMAHSFSSDNQTVIERTTQEAVDQKVCNSDDAKDLYRAECAIAIPVQTAEGEYHSFTEDDFDDDYDSPVKSLVEKDIRDYSVPINFYCEDFVKKKDTSPIKSPTKRTINVNNVLEPILEESKSSYDDSNSTNGNHTSGEIVEHFVEELVGNANEAIELKAEMSKINIEKMTPEVLMSEYLSIKKDSFYTIDEESDITTNEIASAATYVQTAMDVYTEDLEVASQESTSIDQKIDSVYNDVFNLLSTGAMSKPSTGTDKSLEPSVISGNEIVSFNSTYEFEAYEAVTEVIVTIFNRINFASPAVDVIYVKMTSNFDLEENCDKDKIASDSQELENSEEHFSITKMINDIEVPTLNETVLTECSDIELNIVYKIIEPILYYILNAVQFICSNKEKANKAITTKEVITVVDVEDILFTAASIWSQDVVTQQQITDDSIEENVKEITTQIHSNTSHIKDNDSFTVSDASIESFSTARMKQSSYEEVTGALSPTDRAVMDDESNACDDTIQNDDDNSVDVNSEVFEINNNTFEFTTDTYDSNSEMLELVINIIDTSMKEHDGDNDLNGNTVSNETFDVEDMNTAFVEEAKYSRSSSPNRTAVFESCDASPIKNPRGAFAGDDLSVLYDREETILGSPFVRQAPVISMSQTEHTGGIKYWLSFDDSLTNNATKPCSSRKMFRRHNEMPSFLSMDLNDLDYKTETTQTEDSYVTASGSNRLVDDSEVLQKRLIYDSRGHSRRLYTSWPPFDDTLFYKLISKFRMSESFDPSDLDNNIDGSL